jgi:uncharacterized phage protein (TIGR02216 family)
MGGGEFARSAARLAGAAGLLLGWSPDSFWRATPAELRTALEALVGPREQPLGRREMDALRERFPDQIRSDRGGSPSSSGDGEA